jgi:hypothetical protein
MGMPQIKYDVFSVNGLSYTSALMCGNEMVRIPFLHTASHILYYIPSYKTFLSGMIEVRHFAHSPPV